MENISDDFGPGDQKQTSTQDKQKLSIQHCLKYLIHACKCKDADCRFRDCQRMKNVVQHCNRCSKHKKANGGCPVCKQFIALCCFHAQHCQEPGICPIPFCINIKSKMRTQQLRKRLQQAQILRKRVTIMQNRAQSLKTKVSDMQNHRMSGGLFEPNPENSSSSGQSSPGAQPRPSSHSQSDIAMKPSQGPPIGALLAVQQVQAAAARQIAQAQIQNAMSHMMSSIPNYMLNRGNVASWGNSGYAQNHQPRQNTQPLANLQLGLQQPLQIMRGPNSVSNSIGSTMGPPQLMPNPGSSVDDMQRSAQDWQQLFQTLRISSANLPPPNPGPSVDDMQRSTQDWQQLFQTLRISSANSPPPQSSSYP